MQITIYGTGYVGLVTGACLARLGHEVLCVDIDASKISMLQAGRIPIWEPGLDETVQQAQAKGNLRFSCDPVEGAEYAELQMIAVGTPPDENGAPNLSYLLNVARTIGRYMPKDRLIINKSTVPVGTAELVERTARQALNGRCVQLSVEAVSNPEFLKEGTAVSDFMAPDRIIIGARTQRAFAAMRCLYEPLLDHPERILFMQQRAAELTKYAANALLATKVSFMNEMSNLAEHMGVDIKEVQRGIGSDPRIGPRFINASCGFGGSCFPKDILGLLDMAAREDVSLALIEAVDAVNQRQRRVLFDKIAYHFGGADRLAGKCFALWGLAFKANTDDIRMSPAIELAEALLAAGARVIAHDPAAADNARQYFAGNPDFGICHDQYQCADGANALIVTTEWPAYRQADLDWLRELLVECTVFDGRNLFDPETMDASGMVYYGIGRGKSRFSGTQLPNAAAGGRRVRDKTAPANGAAAALERPQRKMAEMQC